MKKLTPRLTGGGNAELSPTVTIFDRQEVRTALETLR